jgi:hypothetical protein
MSNVSSMTFRFICAFLLAVTLPGSTSAESPSPAASPAKTTATPAPSPSASTIVQTAPTPGPRELIDTLTPKDLDAVLSLLKKNFTKPDAINETQLSRATIEGLIMRLGPGLIILPDKKSAPTEVASPFYSDLLENHVAYLRLGTLNSDNLQALDKKLAEFPSRKIDAVVIDLRASSGNDFASAAEFAKRFTPKGKLLFGLKKQEKQERAFTSERDPAFQGLIVVLADTETGGGAEAVGSVLRFYDKALIIGQSTAARAVEYSDLSLPSGKILRVAVAEVTGPDGQSLYPGGLKPDVEVEMSLVDKRQIFRGSSEKGMGPFIYETERPHLNEAALIAGTNPELDVSEQHRNRSSDRGPRDAMLQRALDVITSLEIYGKR